MSGCLGEYAAITIRKAVPGIDTRYLSYPEREPCHLTKQPAGFPHQPAVLANAPAPWKLVLVSVKLQVEHWSLVVAKTLWPSGCGVGLSGRCGLESHRRRRATFHGH